MKLRIPIVDGRRLKLVVSPLTRLVLFRMSRMACTSRYARNVCSLLFDINLINCVFLKCLLCYCSTDYVHNECKD